MVSLNKPPPPPSSLSSSSSYRGIGPLFVTFRSRTFRSLFSILPPFLLPFFVIFFYYPRNLLRGFLFTRFSNFFCSPAFGPKLGLNLFCTVTNKCTINWRIIILLHISTLLCHPQGARSQYLDRLHKNFKCSCWSYNLKLRYFIYVLCKIIFISSTLSLFILWSVQMRHAVFHIRSAIHMFQGFFFI
jgi:hypothetical protein